jgi:hypothetical protein
MARFAYGFAATVLILLGVALVVPVSSDKEHPGPRETGSQIAIGIVSGAIPIAIGVGCLFRYRHWQRKANWIK